MGVRQHRAGDPRAACIAELAAWVAGIEASGPLRVALDGPDAAGKTTLAGELAAVLLSDHALQVVRVSADDFQAPAEQRHRRGRYSPDGYLLEAFDQAALRRRILAVAESAVVLVDGVFLQRPPLLDVWDAAVWVEVTDATILTRALARDVDVLGSREEVWRLYEARYLPAQRAYAETWRPGDAADVVLRNDDPNAPQLRWRRPGDAISPRTA